MGWNTGIIIMEEITLSKGCDFLVVLPNQYLVILKEKKPWMGFFSTPTIILFTYFLS